MQTKKAIFNFQTAAGSKQARENKDAMCSDPTQEKEPSNNAEKIHLEIGGGLV